MAKLKQKKDNNEKQRELVNEQIAQNSIIQPQITPVLPVPEYANVTYQDSSHSTVSGNDSYHLSSSSLIPQNLPAIVLPDTLRDPNNRGILTPGSTPNSVSSESSE